MNILFSTQTQVLHPLPTHIRYISVPPNIRKSIADQRSLALCCSADRHVMRARDTPIPHDAHDLPASALFSV